jgi:hypothetical protein
MECQNLATNAQKNVFGLQAGGECWADTNVAYGLLGPAQNCSELGSAWANQVYTSPTYVQPLITSLAFQPVVAGTTPVIIYDVNSHTISSPVELGNSTMPGYKGKLTSPSGTYRAVMQDDGNFVVYRGDSPIWALNNFGVPLVPGAWAGWWGDSFAILNPAGGAPIWKAGEDGKGGVKLVMQDDGNLVVYDSNNNPTWSTGTAAAAPPPAQKVHNFIIPGQSWRRNFGRSRRFGG